MGNVEFDIARELALVTLSAQIVRSRYVYGAHYGEDWLAAQLAVVSLLTARTFYRALVSGWDLELQQFGQDNGAGPMHGRAYGCFDGFQIEMTSFPATGENRTQELFYFARDFLADRFGRFFSSGDPVSSAGRARQICVLTSMKARLSSWYRRNSSSSR